MIEDMSPDTAAETILPNDQKSRTFRWRSRPARL